MTPEAFEALVAEEFPNAVPEKFRGLIQNLVFLVEKEPSAALRKLEGLRKNETLLGHYRGIPSTVRGSMYGVGSTLPDTITLFQHPIEEAATELEQSHNLKIMRLSFEKAVREVVRDTIWHEVGHHFGLDEYEVRSREDKRRKLR